MTDDTSPENLRKFLKSDDPALVRMGISLAKGAGVEITVKDFERFLKSDDIETIKTGIMLADEAGIGDEAMEILCEALGDDNVEICQATAEALGEINDARAVEPLIKALRAECNERKAPSWEGSGGESAAKALGKIGDARAVEPLVEALNVIDKIKFYRQYKQWMPGDWSGLFYAVVESLAKIGDKRAIEPLVEALDRNTVTWDDYHGLFTIPIVEALIEIGIDTITENERFEVGRHLRIMLEIGTDDEANPGPGEQFDVWTTMSLICEIGPVSCSPGGLIREIGPRDETFCDLLIQTSELGGGTYYLIRIMEESRGIYRRAAAEALDRQGWQPDTDEHRVVYLVAKRDWNAIIMLGASAVEPLIRELEYEGEGDDDALEPIARVLGDIGDARAVEPIIALLSDGSYWDGRQQLYGVAGAAVEALENIGELAIAPLIKVLRDKDHHIAAETLDRIARTSTNALAFEPFIETLSDMLKNRDIRIHQAIANILENIGWEPKTDELRVVYLLAKGDVKGFVEWGEPVVEYLIEALEDESQEAPWVAAEALGKIGDTRAVEPLIKALGDGNSSAAEALGMIGDTRAVEPLIKAFGDDDDDLAAAAVDALGMIGDERAVEPIIKALGGWNSDVRRNAVYALGGIGDARAVDPLIKALEDDDWEVRKNTAEALVMLDWKPETKTHRIVYQLANYFPGNYPNAKAFLDWGDSEVEILIKLLERGNSNAAWALGKIGDPRAIEPLIKALRDDGNVRYLATDALVEIGETAVDLLIKALGDDDNNVQWGSPGYAVVLSLGHIGNAKAVKPLIQILRNAVNIGNPRNEFSSVLEALVNIGEPAVTPLIQVLGDEGLRYHVMDTLRGIGEPTVLPFISALGDRDHNVRRIAAEELGKKGNTQAVEPLIKLLRDEDKDVHETTTKALIEIGEPAIRPLVKALDDHDIRNSAAWILDRLGWKSDDYGIYVSGLLVSSGLKLSPEKQKEIEGIGAKLLPKEKVMNLEQEEFAKIVEERNSSLETMEHPCTAEELIELLAGASSQTRWIVACGIVEICCYDDATIDKLLENPINIFWSRISDYPHVITEKDRDEIVKVLRSLPPTLLWKISNGLMNFAIASSKDKEASAEVKKNRKMVTTIVEMVARALLARE